MYFSSFIKTFLLFLALPILVLGVLVNWAIYRIRIVSGLARLQTRRRVKSHLPPKRSHEEQQQATERSKAVLAQLRTQGYDTDRAQVVVNNGRLAVRIPYQHYGSDKYILYLEGTAFERGRFTGILAPRETLEMTSTYVDYVVFNFLAGPVSPNPLLRFFGSLVSALVLRMVQSMDARTPRDITAEMCGLWEGSRLQLRSRQQVSLDGLYTLNYGVDAILSLVYAGIEPLLRLLSINPRTYRVPVNCNAFSAKGDAVLGGGHYFGRDFMFPTANVFNTVATQAIHRPLPGDSPHIMAHVRMTAPGMAGAIAGLNQRGLAMGVDMVAGRNSNWKSLGLNSLLLVREAVQRCGTSQELQDFVIASNPSVSWLYPFSSAEDDSCGTLEVGAKVPLRRFQRWIPSELQALLPSESFVREHPSASYRQGVMMRTSDTVIPAAYYGLNPALFEAFDKPYVAQRFGTKGVLNPGKPKERRLPGPYYFAPQRVERKDVNITTNFYLCPEMRLFSMNRYTAMIPLESGDLDDFQWRYDRLNLSIDRALSSGPVDWDEARNLANFLRPFNDDGSPGPWPEYYNPNELPFGTEFPIGGSVSICDVINLKIESLWGTYGDPWLPLDLGPFFIEEHS